MLFCRVKLHEIFHLVSSFVASVFRHSLPRGKNASKCSDYCHKPVCYSRTSQLLENWIKPSFYKKNGKMDALSYFLMQNCLFLRRNYLHRRQSSSNPQITTSNTLEVTKAKIAILIIRQLTGRGENLAVNQLRFNLTKFEEVARTTQQTIDNQRTQVWKVLKPISQNLLVDAHASDNYSKHVISPWTC